MLRAHACGGAGRLNRQQGRRRRLRIARRPVQGITLFLCYRHGERNEKWASRPLVRTTKAAARIEERERLQSSKKTPMDRLAPNCSAIHPPADAMSCGRVIATYT